MSHPENSGGRTADAVDRPRRPYLLGPGPLLIAMAPLAEFSPGLPVCVRTILGGLVMVLGLAIIVVQMRKGAITITSCGFNSLSTDRVKWTERIDQLTTDARKEAFKYFQTTYFHQDRLMWSRLQLFFAIQAATLSLGLTHSDQLTACLALATGIVLALSILDVFIEDDMFRRAARVAMQVTAEHTELMVPIVGVGDVYHHPTMTIKLMWLVIAVDAVVYVVRLTWPYAYLG